MAIVGVAVAYMVYRTIYRMSGGRQWGIFVGGFIAAWASIELAALACAFQLAASGTSPANVAIPAMGSIHALIGIGEGLITLGALAFLFATRRDLLTAGDSSAKQGTLVWGVGLAIALLLAVFSPLASAYPDGLEWVAEEHGFIETAQGPLYEIIPDYVFPGVSNEALATILAGIIGTLIVFGVALAIGYARRKRQAA
jgi:cobalt/nickel transport system permease protein